MLDSIVIEGFKSIRRVEVGLRPINVLIGANGSGKSNFIEVFRFLNAVRHGRLQESVLRAGGAERLLHFGSKTTQQLRFELSFEDGRHAYQLDLATAVGETLVPLRESVVFWDQSRYPEPLGHPIRNSSDPREAGIADSDNQGIATYVRGFLDQWLVYHFHDTSASSPLRRSAQVDDNRFLRYDGANLAAFLYRLQEQHPECLAAIRDAVRLVAPYFGEFRLAPRALDPSQIRLEWTHLGSNDYFDAHALSDGTLRFIALAVVLLQPSQLRLPIVVVDEPELGLHPSALALFGSLVKSASRLPHWTGGTTQIVLATQSATLLDSFEPEDVLVAEREDGATMLRRLDADALRGWLEDYSLGQLWEKNELGGRPVKG
jgi:predicted ATPase